MRTTATARHAMPKGRRLAREEPASLRKPSGSGRRCASSHNLSASDVSGWSDRPQYCLALGICVTLLSCHVLSFCDPQRRETNLCMLAS